MKFMRLKANDFSRKKLNGLNIKRILVFAIFILAPILTFLGLSTLKYFTGVQITSAHSSSNNNQNNAINFENQQQEIQTVLNNNNGLTSLLLVGIDSRNVELKNGVFVNTKPQGQAGTRNTDTLLQIVYSHETKKVFMISIPRDMGVDIDLECLEFHGSIHWVYDKAENAKCPGGGIEILKQTINNITGIPVNYHLFVTLDAFQEIIDIVGEENEGKKGIWVDNPEAFYEVYPYNDYGWENVYFPKGEVFLDAQRALRYIRTRQFTSDWGRAERQQIFINAFKDRVLATETLLNPAKILNLIGTFREKLLFTWPSLQEIIEITTILPKVDTSKITNIVLGPDFGGDEKFINKQPHNRKGGPYYMVPTDWKMCPGDEFCKVKERIASIINYPEVYKENAKVGVYSTALNQKQTTVFDHAGYQNLVSKNLPLEFKENSRVSRAEFDGNILLIDYSGGKYPYTLVTLSKLLNTKVLAKEDVGNLNFGGEEIAIILNP